MSIPATFKTLKDNGFICDVTTGWCEKHQPDGASLFINPFTATALEVAVKGLVHTTNYDDALRRVEEGVA